MFNGANITIKSDVDPGIEMFGLHKRSITYRYILSLSLRIIH